MKLTDVMKPPTGKRMVSQRIVILLLFLGSVLILPPAAVWMRQMVQVLTAPDQDSARKSAADELASILETRRRFAPTTNFRSAPFDAMLMDSGKYNHARNCLNNSANAIPLEVRLTLGQVFVGNGQWRRHLFLRDQLAEYYSAPALAALTGCLEASVFAVFCERATALAKKTGPKQKIDPRLSSAAVATAYCTTVGLRNLEVKQ